VLVKISEARQIDLQTEGEGRPFLWLHSAFRGPAGFDGLISSVQTRLRREGVEAKHYLPYLSGFGRSSPCSEPGVFPYEMADDIERLIEKLNLRGVHLIGYSLGANVASIIANRMSDRVDSLVLLGIAIEGSDLNVYRQLLSLCTAKDWDEVVRFTAQNLVGTKNRDGYLKMMSLVRKQVSSKEFEDDLVRILCSEARLDVFPELKQLSVPTLMVSGDEDHFAPGHEKREALKHNRNIDTVFLEGTGHNELVFPLQVDVTPYMFRFWRARGLGHRHTGPYSR